MASNMGHNRHSRYVASESLFASKIVFHVVVFLLGWCRCSLFVSSHCLLRRKSSSKVFFVVLLYSWVAVKKGCLKETLLNIQLHDVMFGLNRQSNLVRHSSYNVHVKYSLHFVPLINRITMLTAKIPYGLYCAALQVIPFAV